MRDFSSIAFRCEPLGWDLVNGTLRLSSGPLDCEETIHRLELPLVA